MSKETRTFLTEFLDYLQKTEIPELFSLWCGIAGVSCCLGRKVSLNMKLYRVYPNMYVVLVASSGKYRKSTVINTIEDMVRRVEPRPNLISQKLSPEALIEAMQETTDPSAVNTCEGYVFVDELTVFLNRRTYESGLGEILLPLYDCKNLEYRTKSRGTEAVENSCLGLLGGTTIGWLKNAIPEDSIGTGLASRLNFVYVDTKINPVSSPDLDPAKRVWLRSELQRIRRIRGEMSLDDEAKVFYDETYNDFFENSPLFDDRHTDGYASRRGVHLLKLGTIFSAVESSERIVKRHHLDAAQALLRQTEDSLVRVLKALSTTERGEAIEYIYRRIGKDPGGMSRTDLMRLVSHKVSGKELTEIIETLKLSGRIITEIRGKGSFYRISGA